MPRLLLLALVLVAAGCGSGDDGDNAAAPPEPKPTAQAADFPSASGRTLPDVINGLPSGPALAPSVSILDKGKKNRVAFALFDDARKQLSGAPVALYIGKTDGSGARGPYVARDESLAVKTQFRSKQTATDPDAARTVYVADVPFSRKGKYAVLGIAKLDGRLVATDPIAMEVGAKGATPPDVGDKAPVIHTQTRADVGGDLSKIDTRIPPLAQLHAVDFADVLGEKPVVLVFATPQLCQSRVCGPVVDVAAQVQSQVGDDVAFVHQEIFNDNDVSKGYRPQLATYRLPSEPWTFVIDRSGRIVQRFEGAYSVGELQRAVAKVRGS
ncbi:MAG: hypothetical protein HZB46_16170 [Solirubrobacterales bacterium]|nr:hypothetical protein [Solirubrobacterales bacterium]